jgi:hypothetical protein
MKLHWNVIPGIADRQLMKFDLQVLINKQKTNQMEQIDDAFLFRIQVALRYPKQSNDAQMSIREGFRKIGR